MQERENLEMLVCYMAWANDVFYRAVSSLPQAELAKDRPMLFGSILNLLHHIYAMAQVWRAHLEGGTHNFQSRCPDYSPPFSDLWEKQQQMDEWYIDYVTHLPPEKLNEKLNFTFIGGGAGAMSPYEMIVHVVNHTSYHRGHIEGVFYQIGVEPPTTDLPVFLRDYYKSS